MRQGSASLSVKYQHHLDQVSRSFAFCILQLKEPLKHDVSLAYLICRILDTIEDYPYPTPYQKYDQIHKFEKFIQSPPSEDEVDAWLKSAPEKINRAESELLKDSFLIFSDLHQMPLAPKTALQNTALDMARGMTYFLKRSEGTHELALHSLSDVNRYCFFVAGIVGEMLSGLLASENSNYVLNGQNLLDSHQFGLFLQKVNVLKDQLEDQKVGRSLVPSQEQVWKSLEVNAEGAIRYISNLPIEEKEYRTFCGWSLFLGLASIPWIKRTWASKLLDKIPRAATQHILNQVSEAVTDNVKLRALFEELKPAALVVSEPPVLDPAFPELAQLYHRDLPDSHLQALGMISK